MDNIEIIRAAEEWQRAGAYSVRIQGMNRQHGISLREEFDDLDGEPSRYIVALDGGYPVATCRFFEKDEKSVSLGRVVVLPEGLDYADRNNQYDDRRPCDIGHVAVMSVADGEIAEPAGADRACHGGKSEQADGCDRRRSRDMSDALLEVDPHDHVHRAASHGKCGFDQAVVDLCQGSLHLPDKERGTSEYQRNDGTPYIDGCSHDQSA